VPGSLRLFVAVFLGLLLAIGFACSVGDLDITGKTCTGTVCPGGEPCVNGRCSREGPDASATGDACTAPPNDPCYSLPRYLGKQVVDGYADDFCGVPAYVFVPANEVITGPETNNPGLDLRATVQAAWSSSALHVFVHVEKWPVFPQLQWAIYDGDAVEMCVAGSRDDLTGNPDGDPGTTHIIAAPIQPDGGVVLSDGGIAVGDGGIALIYGTNSPQNSAPLGSPMQFASRLEEGVGYDVELEIPWIALGAGAPAPGSYVGFDVGLDIVLPDDAGTQTVYQAFHAVVSTQHASDACVSPVAYPGCDDRTWCRPALGDQ
jgi:hypothetical protein